MPRLFFFVFALLAPVAIVLTAGLIPHALWAFVVVGPIIVVGIHDVFQRTHSLLRIYPVIAHGRYLLESIRPEIQQYFVESNLNGRPYPREYRSVIYQRAKGARDTMPFGTQHDVTRIGYEWMTHSLAPQPAPACEPRVRVGGADCTQPYEASRLNISAMSYGSLSRNAILALNEAAKRGGFCHNTGEGGLSPYHLSPGGDLTWQIGTGYFGCRNNKGQFNPDKFAQLAQKKSVKMIEIKLSQGAKPGHGGILPAAKVTSEIAQIRDMPMGQDILSPPAHSAFSNPIGLIKFVAQLRELSGGKPVGFKLCIGHHREFLGICKAMLEIGAQPDFITVDGAEGGTGAAPVELSNSVGMPLTDGLLFVHNCLVGFGLRQSIRIIAAGKIVTGFHMVRACTLGADICNSARGMLFALGCIQARRCNANDCPVGIATQLKWRYQGLVVKDKARRVYHYHRDTIDAFMELVAAAGMKSPDHISPHDLLRRVDATTVEHFDKIYDYLPEGCLLDPSQVPKNWQHRLATARSDRFQLTTS